jgi:hypothetical protein
MDWLGGNLTAINWKEHGLENILKRTDLEGAVARNMNYNC